MRRPFFLRTLFLHSINDRALAVTAVLFFSILFTACSDAVDDFDVSRRSQNLSMRAPGSDIWKTENPHCQVRGNTANWQASYCMYINHTKEFDDDLVQQCYKLATDREGIPRGFCERNLYFKREICRGLVLDHYFGASLDECMQSDESVPLVVREGL